MAKHVSCLLLILASAGSASGQIPATLIRSDLPLANSSPALADLNGDGKMDLIFVTFEQTAGAPGRARKGGVTALDIPCIIGGTGDAKGKGAGPNGPGTGVRGVLKVHALDGAASPPYTAELPGLWPRTISTDDACLGDTSLHPTVAIATVDPLSCDELDVVVGYDRGTNERAFAFRPDGSNLPGWPRTSQEPPFLGSFAVADINRQGTKSPIGVDESCHMQRYTALGKRVQCQWVAQNVISSA